MSKGYLVISADCHAGRTRPCTGSTSTRSTASGSTRARTSASAHRADAARALRRRDDMLPARRIPGGVVRRGRGGRQPPRGRAARRMGRRSATRSSSPTASPARSCSPVPTRSPARWARRSAPASPSTAPPIPCSCSPARARTTGGPPSSAREPAATRRPHRGADPRRHRRRDHRDHARAHGEGLWGGMTTRPVGQVRVVHQLQVRPDLGGCESLDLPVHTHSGPGRARRLRHGAGRPRAVRERDGLVDVAPAVVHLVGRVRALPRAEDRRHRSGVVLGADLLWRSDSLILKDQGSRKLDDSVHGLSRCSRASTSTATSRSGRRTPAGASWPSLRDRRRQHHVGQRLPPPRGHLAVHQADPRRGRSTTSPSTRPRDPRAQRRRVLRLRRRHAAADRRRDRADPRGPRPDRRGRVRQVGQPAGRRPSLVTGHEAVPVAP